MKSNPRVNAVFAAWSALMAGLERLQPAAQLAARLYVAQVFFSSGLTKLRDWEITVALFTDEYHVPWLSPEAAAWAGTGGELVLPVLLLLGLAGRCSAMGLFAVNLVAVISLSDIAPVALQQHQFWGSLLAALVLWGPGRWSADRWVAPRLIVWLGAAAPAKSARLTRVA